MVNSQRELPGKMVATKEFMFFFTSQNVPAFPSLGSCHYQDYKDDYLEELQSS